MGVQTVEVSQRPGASSSSAAGGGMAAPSAPAAHNDVEKQGVFAAAQAAGSSAGDQWGKNMQRWRNDNIDIAKGS